MAKVERESWPKERFGLLPAMFLLVIVGFICGNVLALLERRSAQATSRLVVEDMLTSIELVSRLSFDVARKRHLINRHIYEAVPAKMNPIEQEIAEVDADYGRTARKFEPLAELTGEESTWHSLQDQVKALAPTIIRTMA